MYQRSGHPANQVLLTVTRHSRRSGIHPPTHHSRRGGNSEPFPHTTVSRLPEITAGATSRRVILAAERKDTSPSSPRREQSPLPAPTPLSQRGTARCGPALPTRTAVATRAISALWHVVGTSLIDIKASESPLQREKTPDNENAVRGFWRRVGPFVIIRFSWKPFIWWLLSGHS